MTHYIPAFTRINGHKQAAVCGEWVRSKEHSAEPTCPKCLAYVQGAAAREADDEETARSLEAQYPEFRGRLVTKEGGHNGEAE